MEYYKISLCSKGRRPQPTKVTLKNKQLRGEKDQRDSERWRGGIAAQLQRKGVTQEDARDINNLRRPLRPANHNSRNGGKKDGCY